MKYLVMETHPGYAVFLDEDGRFIKGANMNYTVGDSVYEIIPFSDKAPKRSYKWLYSVAAIAACFVLVAAFALNFFTATPYASVYISINPRVRIDVDKNDSVMDVVGVNDDGISLVANYDHGKKPLETVMDELVDLAIEQGYLAEGGKITLTLDAKNDEWVVAHSDHLSSHLNEHLTDRYTVTITVGAASDTPTDPVTTNHHQEKPNHESKHNGNTDYHDTDYGVNSDGVTDYSDTDYNDTDYGTPVVTEPVPDTDYSETLDSHADYYQEAHDPDTDYGISDYESATDYHEDIDGDDEDEIDDIDDEDDGDEDGESDYE